MAPFIAIIGSKNTPNCAKSTAHYVSLPVSTAFIPFSGNNATLRTRTILDERMRDKSRKNTILKWGFLISTRPMEMFIYCATTGNRKWCSYLSVGCHGWWALPCHVPWQLKLKMTMTVCDDVLLIWEWKSSLCQQCVSNVKLIWIFLLLVCNVHDFGNKIFTSHFNIRIVDTVELVRRSGCYSFSIQNIWWDAMNKSIIVVQCPNRTAEAMCELPNSPLPLKILSFYQIVTICYIIM